MPTNNKNKKYAVVFDYAGTLAGIKRVIKVANTNEFICNRQTVDIVDEKKGRALVIIKKEKSIELIEKQNPDNLITDFLDLMDWKIIYCNLPINKNNILKDKNTTVENLQHSIRVIKKRIKRDDYGSAVIIDTHKGEIEYTVATSGALFSESKNTIKILKEKGINVFIATGDSKYSIRNLSKELNIDGCCILSEAHQKQKKKLISDLKDEGYVVVMVGDASNDIPAMIESDVSVVTLQNGNTTENIIKIADYSINNICEIIGIVDKI
ncbi:MAG: HAD family hydrolase [Methanosarcinaceae archaeon]|nr:HAD family hydrolase [Methanosarcinaceae archaeon]NKQ39869.1 HAD family hydrolase [Methanosarcinales archaeon]